jgi:hypothetical protein
VVNHQLRPCIDYTEFYSMGQQSRDQQSDFKRTVLGGCATGASWALGNALGMAMADTKLSGDKFCDSLAAQLRYVLKVDWLLSGTIHELHTESFSHSAVRSEAKINLCCTTKNGSIKQAVDTDRRRHK